MAQMNNTVDVEHVYKPEIKDANRISVQPEVKATTPKHSPVDYATTSSSVKNYTFTPIWAAKSDKANESAPRRFVTIGGGTEGNLLGRAAVGFELNKKHIFDIKAGFSGHNAKVNYFNFDDEEWKSRFYTTTASAGYEFKMNSETSILVNAEYESQVFNYQQDMWVNPSYFVTDKQHNTLAKFSASITPYKIGDFSIAGGAEYEMFSQKYKTIFDEKCSEGVFSANANMEYKFNSTNSIDLAVTFANTSYSKGIDGYTDIGARPHYRWHNDNMSVKAGLYIGTLGIAPDINFTYHMSQALDIYADITGGEACANTFRAITAANPYWALATDNGDFSMKQQFNQLSALAGIRFSPIEGLSIDANTGYELSKDRMEFTPASNGTNVYAPVFFADGNRFFINANASYTYKNRLSVNMSNQFNVWSIDSDNAADLNDVLWRPILDLDWSASFRIIGGLRAGADFRLQTFKDKKEYDYTRPATVNLGASLSYTLSRLPLTVYVKGNNLLNQDYDNYFMYKAPGINILAGAAITF